jgi:hypothetical protein
VSEANLISNLSVSTQSNAGTKNVARSITLAIGVVMSAALGFIGLTVAETSSPTPGALEDKIAVTAIGMFDDVCIKNAFDQASFNSSMGKLAQRQLTFNEYQYFVPGGSKISESFYDIPILDGKAHIFVGLVRYKDGGQNCLVVLKVDEKIAMRHWLNLYLAKYNKKQLQRDKHAPYYFVDRGRRSVMVQITHEQIGERRDLIAYYSHFK